MYKLIKKYIGMFLYEIIGKNLPTSFSRVQIGQKKFRAFCANLFIARGGRTLILRRGRCFLGIFRLVIILE